MAFFFSKTKELDKVEKLLVKVTAEQEQAPAKIAELQEQLEYWQKMAVNPYELVKNEAKNVVGAIKKDFINTDNLKPKNAPYFAAAVVMLNDGGMTKDQIIETLGADSRFDVALAEAKQEKPLFYSPVNCDVQWLHRYENLYEEMGLKDNLERIKANIAGLKKLQKVTREAEKNHRLGSDQTMKGIQILGQPQVAGG